MKDPIDLTPTPPSSLKTSISHPLSISPIIPPELIPFISSHLTLTSAPTLFALPYTFNLDRLLASHNRSGRNSLEPFASTAERSNSAYQSLSPLYSTIYEALKLNLSGHSLYVTDNDKSATWLSCAPCSTSAPPLHVSTVDNPTPSPSSFHEPKAYSFMPTLPLLDQDTDPLSKPGPLTLLGNLLLSSCPGKKVRLNGPVGGRSGVCRDIVTDLERIKELGVGCIVCCLDDEELSFLGIPWTRYERSARDIGIDVLRLPIPEGLAPLDPFFLDKLLMQIITNYTLRGIPILAHCRGGVGRAGVVACCWLIKLGLSGWIRERGDNATRTEFTQQEILQYVARVIGIVRKRRSMKAIETYEQVKFLVEFVEYLKQRT
ncbi:hypothetical protein AX17_005792 [Amanita inopinata Kibby_2008]|nr:hypothetical protein AX17_005792 [Amanita inopinata Kibby_2008]